MAFFWDYLEVIEAFLGFSRVRVTQNLNLAKKP